MVIAVDGDAVRVNLIGLFTPELIRQQAENMLATAQKVELAAKLRAELNAREMPVQSLWYNRAKPGDFYYIGVPDSLNPGGDQVWSLARGTYAPRRYWKEMGVDFARVSVSREKYSRPAYVRSDGSIVIR